MSSTLTTRKFGVLIKFEERVAYNGKLKPGVLDLAKQQFWSLSVDTATSNNGDGQALANVRTFLAASPEGIFIDTIADSVSLAHGLQWQTDVDRARWRKNCERAVEIVMDRFAKGQYGQYVMFSAGTVSETATLH